MRGMAKIREDGEMVPAKTPAERQRDLRQRKRDKGHIDVTCSVSPAMHANIKRAAGISEATLDQFVRKCIARTLAEMKATGRM